MCKNVSSGCGGAVVRRRVYNSTQLNSINVSRQFQGRAPGRYTVCAPPALSPGGRSLGGPERPARRDLTYRHTAFHTGVSL